MMNRRMMMDVQNKVSALDDDDQQDDKLLA